MPPAMHPDPLGRELPDSITDQCIYTGNILHNIIFTIGRLQMNFFTDKDMVTVIGKLAL